MAMEYRAILAAYQTASAAYADSFEKLVSEVEDKNERIKQLELDNKNEISSRRVLQEMVDEMTQEAEQQKCPFVVMLIDADGYIFRKELLNKAVKGGEEAADMLNAAVCELIKDLDLGSGVAIHVRAYANIGGLSAALKTRGLLNDINMLRYFVSGFNCRKGLFDFVDVGTGKEKADHKLRANIDTFVKNPHCKQIIVACGHDAGYATSLRELAGDYGVKARITLLEGHNFLPEIRGLGFKVRKFDSVFEGPLTPSAVGPQGPGWARSALPIQGAASSGPGAVAKNHGNGLHKGVQFDVKNGRRIDSVLEIDDAVFTQMRRGNYCFYHYLKGGCSHQFCPKSHTLQSPTQAQCDALRLVARNALGAHKDGTGGGCRDPMCLLDHSGL